MKFYSSGHLTCQCKKFYRIRFALQIDGIFLFVSGRVQDRLEMELLSSVWVACWWKLFCPFSDRSAVRWNFLVGIGSGFVLTSNVIFRFCKVLYCCKLFWSIHNGFGFSENFFIMFASGFGLTSKGILVFRSGWMPREIILTYSNRILLFCRIWFLFQI